MVSFLDLNEDIICFHIVPYLDEVDIQSLFLTCKDLYLSLNQSIVWQEMFKKAFKDDNVPFSIYYKWPQLYKIRKDCKLLTFGNNGNSRLGWFFAPGDQSIEVLERDHNRRLIKPVELEFGKKRIADVAAGGYTFCVLTTGGDLYFTGRNWHGMTGLSQPGPSSRDYHFARESPSTYQPGRCVNKAEVPPGVKINQIGCGRSHFIGFDTHNQRLFTWDSMGRLKKGVELALYFDDNNKITNEILMIRAGWSFSTCLVHNVGIVVWNRRENLKQVDGEYGPVRATVSVIDGTSTILDYIVLDSFLIYLTDNGDLYKVKLSGDFGSRIGSGKLLKEFQEYVDRHSQQVGKRPRFVRLSGSFDQFSAITNDDQVLFGNRQSDHPKIYKELQHNSVISIAVGDYHYLALNKKGELYSWGRESHKNGCLGLGKLTDALSREGVREDGADIVVEHPIRVPIEGQVLAIAAGGWQSAALVHEN
ncbi:hypothetical protein OGAPHI_007027 [Ogataea philodendri]|uniref:F-box domain-containing protein n=1 Tax=Ogataea philodendri TaxID=1378263 RepID=A0A9P8T0C0_9ASCO|nr:uncharacterized protein OGAPHI_007027 [Ogataea philodendri]KAH3660441.1 hypothetical protein OGAPHI_007027 [Ogataea philodendri]